MKFRDLVRLVLSNLRRMKMRVAMTAIGVIIGTTAVVILVSLGAGLQQQATQSLYGMGSLDELTISSGGRGEMVMEVDQTSNREQYDAPILDAKTLEEIRQMEGVAAVMPMLRVEMQGPLKLDKQEGWGDMVGVNPDAFAEIVDADRGSLDMYRGQAVIGAEVAQNFIPWELRERSNEPPPPPEMLNETLQLTKYTFDPNAPMPKESAIGRLQIVGILKPRGYQFDYAIFVPLAEAQRLNQRYNDGQPQPNPDKKGYSQAIVKVQDAKYAPAVEASLKEQGFTVFSSREMLKEINRFFTIFQAILGGIGAVALLVAAFGIANTMVMAIYERTREIGLMKAIGATNQDVMSIFLAEAGSIGFLGGVGGVLLSMGINAVINVVGRTLIPADFFGGPAGTSASLTAMPLWLPLFAIAFATLIGIASGIYPAIRAAALSPIRALKYE